MSNKPRFQSSNNRNNSKIKGVDVYYNNTISALSATNVQEAIDEVYDLIGGAPVSADNVTYDNSTSSLVSSNVQDAIDELDSNIGAIEPIAASDVTYDNGDSGLSATDVKSAIDELDSNHSAIPTTTVTEDQTGLQSDRDNFANIWSDKTGPSLTTHVLATQRDDGDTFLGFYNRDYLSNIKTIENVRKSIIDLPSLLLNHGGGAYKGSGINTGEEVGFAAYGTRNVRAEYRGLGTGGGSPATIINVDDTTGFAPGDFMCLSNIKEHVSLNSVFTQNAEGLYVVDSVDSATTLKVKAPASHTAFLCKSSVDLAFDPSNDNTYSSSAATAYVDQVEIGALFYRPVDQSFIYTHASNETDFLNNERFIATSASLTSGIGSNQYSILGSVSGNRNWTFKKVEEGTNISIADDGDALTISSSSVGLQNAAGSGESIIDSASGPNPVLKRILGGTDINASTSGGDVVLDYTGSSGATTFASVGTGESIVSNGSPPTFEAKSFIAGTGMSVSSTSDELTYTNTDPNIDVDLAEDGTGTVSLISTANATNDPRIVTLDFTGGVVGTLSSNVLTIDATNATSSLKAAYVASGDTNVPSNDNWKWNNVVDDDSFVTTDSSVIDVDTPSSNVPVKVIIKETGDYVITVYSNENFSDVKDHLQVRSSTGAGGSLLLSGSDWTGNDNIRRYRAILNVSSTPLDLYLYIDGAGMQIYGVDAEKI